jgi:hypothetical protein
MFPKKELERSNVKATFDLSSSFFGNIGTPLLKIGRLDSIYSSCLTASPRLVDSQGKCFYRCSFGKRA